MNALLIAATEAGVGSHHPVHRFLESLGAGGEEVVLVLVVRGDGPAPAASSGVSVHEVRRPYATSFSDARNAALEFAASNGLLADADLVGFPDDDSVYPEGRITAVGRVLEDTGADFVCGPYGPSWDAIDWRRFSRHRQRVTRALVMRATAGSAFWVRAVAVRDAARFDERFGIGAPYGSSEDADFILRLLDRQMSGVYCPTLWVAHPYKPHRPSEYYRGNVAVLAKHSRRPTTILLLARRIAGGLVLVARRRLRISEFARALGAGFDVLRRDPGSGVTRPPGAR